MDLPLTHIWQPAHVASNQLMIVLHGLGDSAEGFAGLQDVLDIDSMNYLLLNAHTPYYTGFSWYDVDADQLRSVGRLALVAHRVAPAHVRHLEAAAYADEHVYVVPQLSSRDARDTERVIFGYDAAAATKRRYGCLERLGEQLDFARRVLSARAAHDHGARRGSE